jgi:hypothetical protein
MGVAPGIRGREAEIAVLDDAIDRAASGRLAVVLIDGEAGIGKTRLLEATLEAARCRRPGGDACRCASWTGGRWQSWWPTSSAPHPGGGC